MKILSIAGHNLNSLRVDFKVDFSSGVLKDCGIFAITGPTGAGKTTLLDAITLALYGRTPRAANDVDIISYGASEARAEVVFQTAEGRFKSEWKVRRARGKHDGTVQQSSMEVSTYPEGKILTQKKREAQEKVRDLIKLEYDQFLKSVLLAQGAFKAFLDARESERGEMLEKLSDTSLYTTLSKKAFERKKAEEQVLDQLRAKAGNVILLIEEEKLAYTNAIDLLKKEGRDLQGDLELLQIKRNWLITISDLTLKQGEAEKELEYARQRLEQEEPDLQRWEAHQLVSGLEMQWVQYKARKEEQLRLVQQTASLNDRLLILSISLGEASTLQQRAQKQLEQAVANREEKMPLILGAITRQADLRAEEKQLEVFRDKLKLKLQEQKECETKKLSSEKNLTDDKNTLKELQAWLAKHYNYAEAGRSSMQASLLVNQFKRVNDDIKELEIFVTNTKGQLSAAEKKIGRAEDDERQAAKDLQLLQDLQQTTTQELGKLKSRLLKHGEQHRFMLEETRQLIEARQAELSRQEFLAEHLTKLHDGESCPLCGSTEHPNQTLSIADVHREINRLQAELKQQQDIMKEKRLEQVTIDRLMVSLEEYPDAEDLPEEVLPLKYHLVINELIVSHRSLPQKQHEAYGLQEKARNLKEKLKEQMLELEGRKSEASDKLEHLHGTAASHLTALSEIAASYDLRPDTKIPEALPQTLDRYWKEYHQKSTQESVTSQTIPVIEAGIESLAAQVLAINDDLLRLKQDISGKNAIITQFTGEISLAHGGYASPEEARDQLTKAEKLANDLLKQSGDRLNKLQQESGTIQGEKDYAERSLTDLARNIEELAIGLKAGLVELQLDNDISIMERYLLPANERPALEKLHKSLHDRLVWTEAQLESCKNQLKLQQSLAITAEEETVIISMIKEVLENLNDKNNRIGQLEQILKEDEGKQAQIRFLKNDIESQNNVFQKWAALSALIGSENGKKFNQFAQGLTLDRLIVIANHHLQLLNDRYLLKRNLTDQGLRLLIVDRYQADNEREINTLSGGESFLVSLALALGLSEMTSKLTTIDSLFIDEGFGTLDADTLEVALDALRSLQIGGKTIGIISHVERLKEEIYTQVEITKGADGFSTLRVIPEL